MFDPGLKIGQILKNSDIVEIFKCDDTGGMRRSTTTNTLVLVTDFTKGIFPDKWVGGLAHYTGMGENDDRDVLWAENAVLADCRRYGFDIHIFEPMDADTYSYCGRFALDDKPYFDAPFSPSQVIVVSPEIVGKQIKHKVYGEGTIIRIIGGAILVSFDSVGKKQLSYHGCMEDKIIEFI